MAREMGHRYLEIMMDFFGIEAFESIIIEGQVKFPDQIPQIKEKALQKHIQWPKRFKFNKNQKTSKLTGVFFFSFLFATLYFP